MRKSQASASSRPTPKAKPQLRDHRLRAALRGGDVPGEPRHAPAASVQEARDVASRGERVAGAGEDDARTLVSAPSSSKSARELVAGGHRHPVHLLRDVERDRRDAARLVALERRPSYSVTRSTSFSRSIRRRILPDGLFGSSSTKRYSRGRLKRASVEPRQCASSSSPVALADDTRRRRAARSGRRRARRPRPRAHSGWPASASSTSSGWMFSPPEMIMSSTRPTIQRSPSSSRRPRSPVRYQPPRIAFASASGRFQ